jgi:hypothetical protein
VITTVPGPPVSVVVHRREEVKEKTDRVPESDPAPGRVLVLRIEDEAGAPVPAATATTWPSYAGPRHPVGSDGRIRIAGVGEGKVMLWVEAPGYVTTKLRLPAGVDEATAVLSRGVAFRVIVRDGNGDPVSRAGVSIERDAKTRDDQFRDSRRTPTTGEVRFRAPKGEYELKVGRVVRRLTVDASRAGEPVIVTLP